MIDIKRAMQLLDEQKESHEEEINEALSMGIAVLKKEIPEKSNKIHVNEYDLVFCKCGTVVNMCEGSYCPVCGQKQDWA